MIREYTMIKIAKINMATRKARFLIEGDIDVYLPAAVPELIHLSEWVQEVLDFYVDNKLPVITDQIKMIAPTHLFYNYIKNHKELPEPWVESMYEYLDLMDDFKLMCNTKDTHDKYCNIVKGLDNEEGLRLLKIGVKARLLNDEYKPLPGITLSQLKAYAYAISVIMNLKVRKKWGLCERQWNKRFSHHRMPQNYPSKVLKVMKLFSEVDFTPLFNTNKTLFFKCPYPKSNITRLYEDLWNNGYIDRETTSDKFFGLFGIGNSTKPVNWVREQVLLSYFTELAFKPTNKEIRVIALSRFRVNGKEMNRSSLTMNLRAVRASGNWDNYDPTLITIIKRYNGEEYVKATSKHPTLTLKDFDGVHKLLANELGLKHLKKGVELGLLTDDYKKEPSVTFVKLKVFVFGMSVSMNFTKYKRWYVFNEQFETDFSCVHQDPNNLDEYQYIINAFPDVDFNELFGSNTGTYLKMPSNPDSIPQLYTELLENKYIDGTTSQEQFKDLFGVTKDQPPVNWIQSQRHLSYFMFIIFHNTEQSYLRATVERFTIQGKIPHRGSLATAISSIKREFDWDTYDIKLKKIAKNFSQSIETTH